MKFISKADFGLKHLPSMDSRFDIYIHTLLFIELAPYFCTRSHVWYILHKHFINFVDGFVELIQLFFGPFAIRIFNLMNVSVKIVAVFI